MKRTLIALLAAGFALAAGSSFAKAPVEPAASTHKAKSNKHGKAAHKSSHKVATKKSKAHAA